jgi:hypothetical protein
LGLALDEPDKGEAPTRINGLDVLISEEAMEFADDSVVDYARSAYGERLVVRAGYGCR